MTPEIFNGLSKSKFEWISARLNFLSEPIELVDTVYRIYRDIGIKRKPKVEVANGPDDAAKRLSAKKESTEDFGMGRNLADRLMECSIRNADRALKSLQANCTEAEFGESQNMIFWDLNFQFAQSISLPIGASEPFRKLQENFVFRPAPSPCWGDMDWLGYYDICKCAWQSNIELDTPYLDFLKLGGFQLIAFENYCLVILRPTAISRNENLALHAEEGPAVSWGDGSGLYFWNGVEVPGKLIETPELVTQSEILDEHNAEKRRCYQEILGSERFGNLLGLEAIDTKLDQFENEIILFRTRERDKLVGDHIYFAKVICPSTRRAYFLCVPPRIKTADEAVAWTFGKSPDNYNPIIET